jgi:hypothetical protein
MPATLQFAIVFIAAAALVGFVLSRLLSWRAWKSAVAAAILAVVIGAVFDPIQIRIGNAIVAFLSAFGGATLASLMLSKRTG